MGMIPDSISDAYNEIPKGGGGRLPDSDYYGTVVRASLKESRKPWVDIELVVQVKEANSGITTFCSVEVTPLTNKDGDISQGKLKFLKWQLDVLGYNGALKDLEDHVHSLVGSQVEFNISTELGARINPKTGQPYENRYVKLIRRLDPGELAKAPAVPVAEASEGEQALAETFDATPVSDDSYVY